MYQSYGFNPYQQQPFAQPIQQRPVMPQPAMPQASTSPWIVVQTVEQVEQVAVQPGQEAWIMVQNEPVFARREANRMGLISTEYCRFDKWDPHAAAEKEQAAEYVTRAEFEAFVANMKKEWGMDK